MLISIAIPDEAKCLLKSGQAVEFNVPFLEKRKEIEKDVFVGQKLDVKPEKIFHYLRKFVGENVAKGDILAIKKDFFGTKKILSDYDGVIKEIDHSEGKIIIAVKSSEPDNIRTFFKGEVHEIKKGELVIKTGAGKSFGLKQATNDFGGETYYFENQRLTVTDVTNKVLVGQSIADYVRTKAEALGAIGFVTLEKIQENINCHLAQINSFDDLKEITKLKYSYCLVDKRNSKIYFYN